MDIYLIAIGGTGMAPLACLLKELGHTVRGADGPLYPPMSTLLESAGIEPHKGWDPGHLDPPPDLVVVGNAVPRDNPEAEAAERLGLDRVSMPEALHRFFLDHRRRLVIAGTHGKTTTTALASWVYLECGADPGFLVGGIPRNLAYNFRGGGGERFIVEGDEYNAAYFDRGPKFFHYRPDTLVLTSVEYDHADLYPDVDTLHAVYSELVERLPADGLLVACGDSPEVRRLTSSAPCRTVYYGLDAGNDLHPVSTPYTSAEGTRFRLHDPEAGELLIELQLAGEHNVQNVLAVWAAARADGLPAAAVASALQSFAGVKRRMEVVGRPRGIAVIDDFAHHPTAVSKTLQALKSRFPFRRLIAAFEPRSLTAARNLFFDEYCRAFAHADRVLIAPVFHANRLPPEERLDVDGIAQHLEAGGTAATAAESTDALAAAILADAEPGDVIVTMSSGAFDGLPHRLVQMLGAVETTESASPQTS